MSELIKFPDAQRQLKQIEADLVNDADRFMLPSFCDTRQLAGRHFSSDNDKFCLLALAGER